MGVYTEGHAYIIFKSEEAAEKFSDQLSELDIREKYNGYANIWEVVSGGHQVDISFDSNRYPNAEWQCDVIVAELEEFKDDIEEININLTQPYTELWASADNEGEVEEAIQKSMERVKK